MINPLLPTVIFVGESGHDDMSYGALVAEILKDAEEKGLSTKVFSEFPTQTEKSESQGKLLNIPENFEENKKFLDERFNKMGNLDGRMSLYEQTMEDNSALTQEQFREKFIDKIDFPEARELFDKQAKEKDPNKVLGVKDAKGGFKNGETWSNFYWFGAALFHSEKIHGDMAQDVRNGLEEKNADLIIVIAGSPHLPGLSKQLENDFKDYQKIIVSNPNTNITKEEERIHYEATPEALGRIGTLTGFEIDSKNHNRVKIPPIIIAAINSKAELKSVVSTLEESCEVASKDGKDSSNNFSSNLPSSTKKDDTSQSI